MLNVHRRFREAYSLSSPIRVSVCLLTAIIPAKLRAVKEYIAKKDLLGVLKFFLGKLIMKQILFCGKMSNH